MRFESSYVRHDYQQAPSCDVAPDGRPLVLKWPPGAEPRAQPLVVFSNWLAELERPRAW